jgi:Zn-finger nucleic acid-binding protein
MKKVDMEAGGKIIYDYCSTCKGFWLDKKELAVRTKNVTSSFGGLRMLI